MMSCNECFFVWRGRGGGGEGGNRLAMMMVTLRPFTAVKSEIWKGSYDNDVADSSCSKCRNDRIKHWIVNYSLITNVSTCIISLWVVSFPLKQNKRKQFSLWKKSEGVIFILSVNRKTFLKCQTSQTGKNIFYYIEVLWFWEVIKIVEILKWKCNFRGNWLLYHHPPCHR